MRKHISSFLNQGLRLIACSVAAVVFVFNIMYHVSVSYNNKEIVTIHDAFGTGFVSLILIAALLAGWILLKKYMEEWKEETLFWILSAVYCVAALYFILNVDITLRADAKYIAEAAEKLRSGDLEIFRTGYLNRYPHQIGMVLYDALLDRFSENHAIQFVMNFLFVLGTNYLLYSISKLLFQDHLTNIFTILLSFCFLPQFFFILFAYNNIPSFFFLLLAFFHLLKFTSLRRGRSMISVVLCAALAVFLRKNAMIGVIAMIICLLLDMLREYSHKHLLLILLLILGTTVPTDAVYARYAEKAEVRNAGIPYVLWIAMGTDLDNHVRGPGWYDQSTISIYKDVDRDPDAAQEIGTEKLRNNLEKIKQEPDRAGKFFKEKIISQWCDPLFQSIWSGPLKTSKQNTHTPLLQSLYNGERAEQSAAAFCRAYTIMLLGLAVWFLLKDSSRFSGWEPAYLFLVGGFLFHIIWEAKSQYIYQYLLILVPFAACTLSNRIREANSLLLRITRRKNGRYMR